MKRCCDIRLPWIKNSERLLVTEVQPNYWRATARFGFMEKPDIPAVLKQACLQNHSLKLGDVVYYVGHGTIVPRDDGRGLPKWQEALWKLCISRWSETPYTSATSSGCRTIASF
jgi:KUP system potassium uptake protein